MSAATSRRLFSRSLLAVPLAGLLLSACAGQDDINRVQPDAIDKSIFFKEDGSPRVFYYRKTITGVPPTNAAYFEGLFMDAMQKVRFEIQKDFLVGYRAYDYAPGSQSPTTSGENNTDTPVLIYKIEDHFDIKREYNPATGEETNVISENTTDRPWNQRQYMRLDWGENQALGEPAVMVSEEDEQLASLRGKKVSVGTAVGQNENPLFNPNRPIFRRDYIDFTHREIRQPDIIACFNLFGANDDVGPWGCGEAEITFRNSLLPVPEVSEYEPLAYPDRELIRGTDGTPLRMAFGPSGIIPCTAAALKAAGLTGDDCTEAALDQFAKFGYFRTALPGYDRQVGATQEGRQFFINRWNIWQETVEKGSDGKPLLDAQGKFVRKQVSTRTPRTITYYLNPEFPEDTELRTMAAQTVEDWNKAMKETVAGLLLTAANQTPTLPDLRMRAERKGMGEIPDVLKMAENSCSVANVNKFVQDHPDVRQMVEARDTDHVLDFDALEQADLLKACTALEVVTESRQDGDASKFTWQRNGDLRYSFLHWIDRPQAQGPLGYGPSSPDPETGEIISASAYIYGAALDTYTKFAADSVRLANGQLSIDDLLSGKTISDVLAETAAASRARATETMTPAARSMIQARLKALGPTREARLKKVGAGIDDLPLHKIKGTTLEKLLFNDDVLPAIIRDYRPGDPVPADVFDRAMAKPWLSTQAREKRRQRFQTLSRHGCIYMADFADDAILGTALELDKAKLSPDALFKRLRALIFRGLADHEIGHTVGLRHNFSASSDALNYRDEYWKVRTTVTDPSKWESEHKLSEHAYASVMDYGARFNSDVWGLGKYDAAAIRFGYGQLFDMIPQSQATSWTGPVGDLTLRDSIFVRDYTKLPALTGGVQTFDEAATTVAPYKAFVDTWTQDFRNLASGEGIHVFPERPYKFCDDMFEGNLDCKTWDRGANQREMVSNVTEQFRNYYAFNAYRRGRINWFIDTYLGRLQERYFNRYSEAFQFFFFMGDLLNDPSFDLGADLFLASIDSLNSIAAILQTPEPGLHCPTALSPTVATFPVNSNGYFDQRECLPGKPQLDIGLPDAKPFYIDFSDEYYYSLTRVGSLLEKLIALGALTSTESRFFRVDELSDVAARSSINYYRLFRDEVVNLLSGVIRNDSTLYGATLGGTGPTYTYQPTPVIDVTTFGFVNPPTPPYAQPGAIRVETPVNRSVRNWALQYALGRLGSTWDNTLDFQNFLAVTVKGADDDFTLGATAAVEYTHPETGITYRAPINAPGTSTNIGRQIIDELIGITGVAGTRGTLPLSIGSYNDGTPLPDWHTAKADVDAAKMGTDQAAYEQAVSIYNYLNQVLGYRMDLISDIRAFRKMLSLP
jgi:hypothetical protein